MRGSTINKLKKNASKYEKDVVKHAKTIVFGRVLAIDPSSGSVGSMPGYAIYDLGKFSSSGTLEINPKRPIQQRLAELHRRVDNLGAVDVLIVERIRGNTAHEYLRWAVGVIVASSGAQCVLEIPTTIWKKYAKNIPEYEKGDESDAIMMLGATVHIALHGSLDNGREEPNGETTPANGRSKRRAKRSRSKARTT